MAEVREVPPAFDADILAGADWGDAYEAVMEQPFATAREAGESMVGNLPAWMQPMLKLRDAATYVVGLKGTNDLQAAADAGMDAIAFFPVMAETNDRLIVGTDDRHLDFRLIIELVPQGDAQAVRLTTLLERHNFMGKAYLATIMPFHRAACRGSLANMAKSRALQSAA